MNELMDSLSLRVFDVTRQQSIPLTKFLNVVGQLKFRGTSVLFRLPRSPVKKQTEPPNAELLPHSPLLGAKQNKDKMGSGKQSPLPSIADKDKEAEEEGMEVTSGVRVAPGCGVIDSLPVLSVENDDGEVLTPDVGGDEDYAIATHFVKVRRSGTLADVNTLWDLVGTEAVSGSVEAILDHKPGFDRLPSINAFDKVHGYWYQY